MHLRQLTGNVDLPEGVTATANGLVLTVKGEKGELSRRVGTKSVHIKVDGSKVSLTAKDVTKRQKRLLNARISHIKNMIKGTTEGHTYKLKICSGHFPMNVSVKDGVFEVKNFIGEAVPRRLKLKEGCDVKVNGQDVVVESVDKELAGNQAADIELLTRRPGFDSRIFQDGIYITEKDGRPV